MINRMGTIGAKAVLALLLGACTFPRPPDVLGEADAIDAPVDARPDLVTGRFIQVYVTDTQSTEVPSDLSIFTVQALVPSAEAPGGFFTRTGVGRADGTFEIDGVTPGVPYLLKFNRSLYVTDQHELTLRSTYPYRGGVLLPSASTPVTVTITGMPATEATDTIALESRLANVQAFLPPVIAGQTQLVATLDWMTFEGPLPDAARGDDLAVYQRRRVFSAEGTIQSERIVAVGNVTPATILDGQTNSFTTALTVPSTTFPITGSLNRQLYEAGHSVLANQTGMVAGCTALPAPVTRWGAGSSIGLWPTIFVQWSIDWPFSEGMGVSGDYPDPFPAAWPRFCSVYYHRERPVRIPGMATTPTALSSGSYRIVDPELLSIAPLAPPTAIRIAGQNGDDGGLIRNDGSPIEITWSGAAQATQYAIAVYQLRMQGTATTLRMAAQIVTGDAHLTLPAELLAGSDFVALEVTAFSGTNDYATGDLYPSGVPGASSGAATAVFRWSATCGNGTVDLGEDCDGPAATCDADCTAVECGDGTRNAAAGELCDSIEDTLGCDDDCTANTCGDGHLNAETEQCDDGGTAAGDGCSPTCRTE